jgi:flagellar protein FlgJ
MQSIGAAAVGPAENHSVPQPRLVRAAHEFEAQMMQELMKPLNHGSSLTGADSDGDDDSGSGGALGEFASEALGRAMSEHGGFGIASSIVKQLSGQENKQVNSPEDGKGNHRKAAPVTANSHLNTVIKS